MTVSDVSPADQDPVGTALKGPQDVVGRYGGRAHDTDGPDIGRIFHAAYTCQIGRAVGTPVAHKSDYLRLKTILFHLFLLLKSQCTLDLRIQLVVIKSHQRRSLRGTCCRTGPTALAQCRVDFGNKLLIIESDGAKRTDINASQTSGAQFRDNMGDDASQFDIFQCQNRNGSCCGRLGLGNGLIYRLGSVCDTANKYTVRCKINRPEFDMGFREKAVGI